MSKTRRIILRDKKDNIKEGQQVTGYIIEETTNKKGESKTIIKKVTGNYKRIGLKEIKKIKLEGLKANEFIKSLKNKFHIIKDETTEHTKKEFRIIDNLKNKIVYSYNWE